MVMVLEVEMVEAIAAVGRMRAPSEACGILLPVPINGKQVLELPNRSKTPHDSFEMHGTDMLLMLETVMTGELLERMIEEKSLTAWHTHPSGNVGPSGFDLRYRAPNMKSLVVTLFEDGRPPAATWY